MPRARTHRIGLYAPPVGAVAPAPTKEDEFTVAMDGDTAFVLTESYVAGGIALVTVNGQSHAQGTSYTIVGNALTWLDSPFTLKAGDCIVATYNYTP